MAKVTINGNGYDLEDGISLREAAARCGIAIPAVCDDPRLKPVGACRLCLVKVEGWEREAASCMVTIEEGMRFVTHSRELESAREVNLKMLARSYPAEAFERSPDKPFHKIARTYGLTAADFAGEINGRRVDDSHTYIRVDMSRCIDCYNCVRICDEVQGQFVWQVAGRGEDSQIVPDNFGPFAESSCVSCGACSDACPTGALEDRSVIELGFAEKWTRTTCPYCGTGCEMEVGTLNDKIVQVRPVNDAPVNHGHLCVKGKYAFGFVDSADRATEPMIRANGEWRTVGWDDAIRFTAERLKNYVSEFGPDSVAVLGSARATNEENYVAQKFARVALGTNNVDCCARVCHTPTAAAMKMMLGTGAATNSFDDIELAETILICGANPTENHPIPGARIKQAVRNGANLIVIDPRKTELTKYADIHLQLKAGTNILLFNALAHAVIFEGLMDEEFVAERVDEFDEFKAFLADHSPEAVAAECGVSADDIRTAARLYATAKPAMCLHGLGMTEHLQGTEGVMTIVNLALLTGNIGKPGTGVNPLRGQNNVQGSAHMGCDPGILTGSVGIDEGRPLFESVWNAAVPEAKGLNQLQMMDSAKSGKLKALWAIGYDVFLSNANSHETERSFEGLEFCIVQDLFLNETAKRFADVFLPAASSFEKDGTFMNAERRVQRIRKAIEPRGNSRTDWQIVCDVAKAMGRGEHFGFSSAEDIWNEIRAVWPAGSGISYPRIEREGLQWPCPDESHPGETVLHGESFAVGKRAALRRIRYRPTPERVSEEYPFLLTTGRTLYHFNAGTMTMRTPNTELLPTDELMISKQDAEDLGIANGERVEIRSAYGQARLPAKITERVKPGELFATFHDPRVFLNYATSPIRDRFTLAPEFKVTAVRIERLD
ncbi:MAG TPA: formate dehydrogenase subunit alpha [Pyrinomonadaceae bacterium]|nr:formate dehydrogenase subunit alpha [Pyrinomonadaceae bacterium]HMP65307.1 formate dehydrogenase subunit alpha [Pyrinomonadaceae bacterium]